MRILILGASGLIGRTVLRVLSKDPSLDVFATFRLESSDKFLKDFPLNKIFTGIDIENDFNVIDIFSAINPEVVINCIGVTKHKNEGNDPIEAIKINALFPHRLAKIAAFHGSRLIHLSTDCVFSGKKGFYTEDDQPDADDIYGKSKALGEVLYGNTVIIRTSTIGYELNTNYGLLNWFLSQENKCKGFKNAIFSGLPTVVLGQIIRDFILNNNDLRGLYHIGSDPINKYDLLKLIANIYKKEINIEIDEEFVINRSLDSAKFKRITGFKSPEWSDLIKIMFQYQ
jgi:dTDP-4-dehydrorhamnose reductase